ncbi:class I SAM-dependent methyltransferase [Rhizobacter sp. LjRoot28]|uniref:class I SAM-dependent methyltransferase n=1 Tax=Rhizobacter sp. LjRoot28 TaxID=3342309 RepID=UPI003ED155C0
MSEHPIPESDPTERLLALAASSLAASCLSRIVLSKPRGPDATLERVTVRPVVLKGQLQLSFVASHTTRDLTSNLAPEAGLQRLRELIDTDFSQVHLLTSTEDVQLLISRKGRRTLLRKRLAQAAPVAEPAAHDREKHRWVPMDRPFLTALGVTDAGHRVVPAMARKWKQINRFVEVFDGALAASPLATTDKGRPLHVVDFGSGKGYLTFAVHDHLQRALGRNAKVTGVELRQELVGLCNDAIDRLGLAGLHFDAGDVRSYTPPAIDVMIALHACDTATDYAIHLGLRAGASIIMCSPCCHKQIRPQLLSPHPLRPILQHGVHLGQEAEMLTDGLRALLLEAAGYDTQVFEFISLEHTNKNKMILAVKRAVPRDNAQVLEQIREVKAFYGIREHCLETLMGLPAPAATPVAAR